MWGREELPAVGDMNVRWWLTKDPEERCNDGRAHHRRQARVPDSKRRSSIRDPVTAHEPGQAPPCRRPTGHLLME